MQLYAIQKDKQIISAQLAQKHQNYYCVECSGIVRVRGGLHKKKHFFHLKEQRLCSLNKKTLEHLQIQWHIQDILGKENCQLEQFFPEINRIADVCWYKKKIIFEVQCSPISAEEVNCRNKDYKEAGYYVIWILHDKRYNKSRLTAAELELTTRTFYFSNINKEGKGFIYDQYDQLINRRRVKTEGPFKINILNPIETSKDFNLKSLSTLPTAIHNRVHNSPYYFFGDLVYQFFLPNMALQHKLLLDEKKIKKNISSNVLIKIKRFIVDSYQLIIRVLLESSCK